MLIALLLCLLNFGTIRAEEYSSPDMLPNPTKGANPGLVCNPDHILTDNEVMALDTQLKRLEQQTSVEMVIVIVNSIGDADPVEYAVDLGSLWGVGKGSNSNGVILLISMENHDIALQSGYGMEGVLTDMESDRIIREDMVPLMREGQVFSALNAAVTAISNLTDSPEVREEIKGSAGDKFAQRREENSDLFTYLVMAVMIAAIMASVGIYVYTGIKARKEKDSYAKSRIWRKQMNVLLVTAIFSVGIGLIFYILAYLNYRRWRVKRRRCIHCGTKMKRLNEEEDNNYLSDAQNTEEKLGSVDYDVWLCPKCGEIEIFPFASKDTKYEPCPRCGTAAYALKYSRVLRQPTPRTPGKGENVKVCEHCGFTHKDDFDIPYENNDGGGGALLAGVALGALAGLGRSGGGGGGGISFGGGSFGGGGASGKW